MDTTRHLLGYFFKVAIFFFVAAILFAIFTLISPALNFKSVAGTGTTTNQDWLPSPRAYAGLLAQRKTPNSNANVYVHGPAYSHGPEFNGYQIDKNSKYSYSKSTYIKYSSTTGTTTNGGVIIPQNGSSDTTGNTGTTPSPASQSTADSNSNLFVRNLSIYEGGHIYTGLSFVGEARSNMFRNGKFPIVTLDPSGKVIGVAAAVATTDWTVAGWTRFETKLTYGLPNNSACTMIFEEALTQAEKNRLPLRVPFAVRCN